MKLNKYYYYALAVIILAVAGVMGNLPDTGHSGYWRAYNNDQDYYLLKFMDKDVFSYVRRSDKSSLMESNYTLESPGYIVFDDDFFYKTAIVKKRGIFRQTQVLLASGEGTRVSFRRITGEEFLYRSLFEGDFTKGEFNNDLFTGYASNVLYRDGRIYTGKIKEGLFNGKGVLITPDGSSFRGNFESGKASGAGVFETAGGGIFSGSVQEKTAGSFYGTGSVCLPSGTRSKSRLIDSKIYFEDLNGNLYREDHLIYPDSSEYRGDLVNGVPHGRGRLEMSDSSVYEGLFRDGGFYGEGVLSTAEGAVYTGVFYRGKLEGAGTYKSVSGSVYRGTFSGGLPHGKGVLYYNGAGGHSYLKNEKMIFAEKYEGDFISASPFGSGTVTYNDGSLLEGIFSGSDMPHGKSILRYSTGETSEIFFVRGKPEDPYQFPYITFLFSPVEHEAEEDGNYFSAEWLEKDRAYFDLLLKNSDSGVYIKDRIFREIILFENEQKRIIEKAYKGTSGYFLFSPELTDEINSIHLARTARINLLKSLLSGGREVPAGSLYPSDYVYRFFSMETSNIQGGYSGEMIKAEGRFRGYSEKDIIRYLENLPVPRECLEGKNIFFINSSSSEYGAVHANGQIIIYNWSDKAEDLHKMIAHEIGHEAGYLVFGRDFFINTDIENKKKYASLYGEDIPDDNRVPWDMRLTENFAEDFALIYGSHRKWSSWSGADKIQVENFITEALESADKDNAVLLRDNIKVTDSTREVVFFGGFNEENMHVTGSRVIKISIDSIRTGPYLFYAYLKSDRTGRMGRFEPVKGTFTIPLERFAETEGPVLYEVELKLYHYTSLQQYHQPSIGRLLILQL